MDNYIIFNNINSKDEGIQIISYDLGAPTPKIVTETVPYMNGEYDFSRLNNTLYYNSRTLTVTFQITHFVMYTQAMNVNDIYKQYFSFKSLLLSQGTGNLDITNLVQFPATLTGSCTNVTGLSQLPFGGTFTATFTCDPFINLGTYGEQLWDEFSFIDGLSEFPTYPINGNTTVPVYNPGVPAKCSFTGANINIISNLQALSDGSYILPSGINNVEFTGQGTLYINFEKEVI